jgi:hypothetical protein
MLRRIVALTAASMLLLAPAALAGGIPSAGPPSADGVFKGAYKGYTDQEGVGGRKLLALARVAHQRLSGFEINVRRYCSDGSSSYVGVVARPGVPLTRRANGARAFTATLALPGGSTATLKGTIRKDWMSGTVSFPDLAAVPASGGGTPAAGATCSTVAGGTASAVTFQLHAG